MSNTDENQVCTTNVFEFKKKAFQHKRPVDDSESDDEDMIFRKRSKDTNDIMKQLEEEDDSDIEIDPNHSKSIEGAMPKVDFILSDDDSDDDDKDVAIPPSLMLGHNISSLESIQRARMARAKLENAQRYHAEDIPESYEGGTLQIDLPSRHLGAKVDVSIQYLGRYTNTFLYNLEPLQKVVDRLREHYQLKKNQNLVLELKQKTLDLTKTPASYKISNGAFLILRVIESQHHVITAAKNLGPTLKLKLRTIANGKLVSEDDFDLKEREPFSKLVELYKTKTNLGPSKHVVLSFEGDSLGMTQTPQTHDMETGEIIEVSLK